MSYPREMPFDPSQQQHQQYYANASYSSDDHHSYPPQNSYNASNINSRSNVNLPDNAAPPSFLRQRPQDEDVKGEKGVGGMSGAAGAGAYPMTRGSIAAQMAAEGQIPKKEGLRMWRSDEHAGALMKGGRGRCCGRVCGCSLILVVIILVSIISAFFLWVRPPSVTFNGVGPPQTGSEVSTSDDGFLLNFNLNIGVINPNFFGASFQSIAATVFYSAAPTIPFGGGNLTNVDIPKMSNSTIRFPFMVNYTSTTDTNFLILNDIAAKCGFMTETASNLQVLYTIRLIVRVIAITITPSFSSSTSFACPLKESDISSLLRAAGITTNGNGSRKRSTLGAADEKAMDRVVRRVMLSGVSGASYDDLAWIE